MLSQHVSSRGQTVYRVVGTILMNAPHNSDSQRHTATEPGAHSAPSGYAPSVPISVYRELATELKTTQTTLDALTQQNQQLLRQNKLLRTEIQRFVQAAEQLGHFAGVVPQEPPATPPEMVVTARLHEQPIADLFANPPVPPPEQTPNLSEPRSIPPTPEPTSQASVAVRKEATRGTERPTTAANSAIVPHPKAKKRDRSQPSHKDPNKHRLFTEQPESMHPMSRVASRSDMGNLWLATTILLVVVSAFGAGFLIMRPLLNR
jgi:hypothetical protein